jgi:exopolysaccharide biosynthesis polyprenyl glycosylphosphotransferase
LSLEGGAPSIEVRLPSGAVGDLPSEVTAYSRGADKQQRRASLMRRLLAGADILGLAFAFLVVELVWGSDGVRDTVPQSEEYLLFALLTPLWFVGATLFGLYRRDSERADHSTSDDFTRVFLLMTVGAFALSWATAQFANRVPDPTKLSSFWLLGIVAISTARVGVRTLARHHSDYLQKTLIVGAGEVGQLIARKLMLHKEYGLDLIGFVDAHPRARRTHLAELPVLGGLDNLETVVGEHNVDRVVIAFSNDSHDELLPVVRRLRDAGVQLDIVPRLFEAIGPKLDIHAVEGVPLLGLAPVTLSPTAAVAKRTIDILGAAFALVAFAPLLLAISVLIKLDSPGPVVFRQTRLGQGLKPFTLLKFRTMRLDTDAADHRAYIAAINSSDADPNANGLYKLERRDSVTKVGSWLRRASLDELPQLINVLKGDMSLVGPRPCIAYELEHFAPHHFERFAVPAGLTGLWQVSARAHSTFGEALDMDVLYAQSYSIGLDLRLLARTPLQLLRSNETA